MSRRLAIVALVVGAWPAAASAHPGHGAYQVSIGTFAFAPQTLNIAATDVVFWTWS